MDEFDLVSLLLLSFFIEIYYFSFSSTEHSNSQSGEKCLHKDPKQSEIGDKDLKY